MAKKSELFHIAREYLELFPQQRTFGRVSTERHLTKVMEENGWDQTELLYRIRRWSQTRQNIAPWDLSKPLPQRTIAEPVQAAAPKAPPEVLGEAPEAWKARVRWIYEEYDDLEV